MPLKCCHKGRGPLNKLDYENGPRLDAITRILAVAVFLLASASARAEATIPPAIPKPAPPTVGELSPAVLTTDLTLRDQWMQCTAAAAKADLRSSRPADAVADAALQHCKAQERPLARALSRHVGKGGAERVLDQVRETDRSNLIRAIEELRAKPQ